MTKIGTLTAMSLSLEATVTKRQAEPVPSDLAERLEQLHHHQQAENARQAEQDAATATPEEPSGKQLKREVHALQAAFLTGNLGKPVTVFTINGLRLTGKLRQFDQFTLLLEGPDGLNSLIFKHAVTTIAPPTDGQPSSRA